MLYILYSTMVKQNYDIVHYISWHWPSWVIAVFFAVENENAVENASEDGDEKRAL